MKVNGGGMIKKNISTLETILITGTENGSEMATCARSTDFTL